ncbi:MAG: SRPBCC family protein [Acidobacteriaceae bacterium]
MKNGHWNMTLAGIYGAGALTMYFLDPQRGKRRRIAVKDAFVHSEHKLQDFSGRFRRDFGHRVEGVVAETSHLFHHEKVSDEILEQRVRTALGRAVSHPHAINVKCKDGSVTLSGWILSGEMENLEKTVASVEGVMEVASLLNTSDRPEHISDLQGGRPRRRLPEFMQKDWSPTARVIAAGTGVELIGLGLSRRGNLGTAIGLAGSVLLGRSILNMPLKEVVGVGHEQGVLIQKTMRINATADELYEFWKNPENYPEVFPHVRKIVRESDQIYRWQISGPAGVPLTWTGTITRQIPNKLVEWHSLPGAAIDNHGSIHLNTEKDGRTQVHVRMSYTPPAGLLGHAFASLFGVDPKSLLDQDFVPLKAVFEQSVTRVRGHEIRKADLQLTHPTA